MTLTCLLRMLPSWDDEMSPVLPSWDADMLLSMLAIFLSRLIRAWLSSSMSCSRPLSWLLYWPGPEYHTTTCSMAWKYIYLVTSNINHNPDASASYYLMACSLVCTFQPMVDCFTKLLLINTLNKTIAVGQIKCFYSDGVQDTLIRFINNPQSLVQTKTEYFASSIWAKTILNIICNRCQHKLAITQKIRLGVDLVGLWQRFNSY